MGFMATTRKDKRLLPPADRGKPFPPTSRAQHGSRTMYFYGCRCEPCRDAEAVYQRERKQRLNAAALLPKEG
jgi:hypothetical protein